MRFHKLVLSGWMIAIFALTGASARAQQHRATHLGNPATRFADPLTKPEDLRARFRDPRLRADMISVLKQAGWKGNPEDLFRAAASERIVAMQIPPGERLPFMSSREKGRAIALMDVLWAGKEPAEAYAFVLTSAGRRYRCVTPKACSNFLVVDLGPDRPTLELEATVPPEAGGCEPIVMKVLLRNAGYSPLTQVRLTPQLPELLKISDGTNGERVLSTLRAGEVREIQYSLKSGRSGAFDASFRAVSAEGATSSIRRKIVVRSPALAIDCTAPAEVAIGRPAEVCLTVRNMGDAAETGVRLTLGVPDGSSLLGATEGGTVEGGKVVWVMGNLAAKANQKVCATFTGANPRGFAWVAEATGNCAPAVQKTCDTRVAGVPGILLEVVDVEDPVETGGEVVYEVRITNQGSAELTQVRPVGVVPDIQEFVSATGSTPVQAMGRQLTMDPVPVLEPKAVVSWRIVTRALQPGICQFQIQLSTDQLPQAFGETESTSQF